VIRHRLGFLCFQHRDGEGVIARNSPALHPNAIESHLGVGRLHVQMICPERPADGRALQFSPLQPFFKKSAAPLYPRNDIRKIRRLSPMKSTPPNRSFSGKPLPSPCHPGQREGSAVLASATTLQEERGPTLSPQ
jgi:hypothetical protein